MLENSFHQLSITKKPSFRQEESVSIDVHYFGCDIRYAYRAWFDYATRNKNLCLTISLVPKHIERCWFPVMEFGKSSLPGIVRPLPKKDGAFDVRKKCIILPKPFVADPWRCDTCVCRRLSEYAQKKTDDAREFAEGNGKSLPAL